MTAATAAVEVPTAQGPGRFVVDFADDPQAVLVLGHGAGGGVDAADLQLMARRLPSDATTVVRFEQPWRTAGRRVAVRPPALDEAWLEAMSWLAGRTELAGRPWPARPLFVGGRSAGARVACRTAAAVGARGVVCFAFPLHLPGQPDKSRIAELLAPEVPRLVLQGSRDTFGGCAEVRAAVAGHDGVDVVELPGADHGFRVATGAAFTPADLRATVLGCVTAFVGALRS